MKEPRIKGQNSSNSNERGKIAERAVCQYFKNRGHVVRDVAGFQVQHDLEVSGIGKVQVKSVHLKTHKSGTSKAHKVFSVFLGSSETGWYASDAFDVLALVWTPKDTHYVVCIPANQMISKRDGRRMASTFSIGMIRFRNIMQPVVKSEFRSLYEAD